MQADELLPLASQTLVPQPHSQTLKPLFKKISQVVLMYFYYYHFNPTSRIYTLILIVYNT
jgi:hypothetical protein